MGFSKLAETTFMSGPADANEIAESPDSKKTNSEILTDKSPVSKLIRPPSIASLKLSNVPVNFNLKSNSVNIERLTSGTPSIKNCLGSLDSIGKSLLKIPGDLVNKVEATINGVTTGIKGFATNLATSFSNMKGIGCVANTLSDGNFKLDIKDKGGLSSLISSATMQGSAMGINNIFSTISNVVRDKDILLSATKMILPSASRDINLLKDLSSTGIKNNIKNLMPSISGNSIKNFRIQPGTTNSQLPNVDFKLLNTLGN